MTTNLIATIVVCLVTNSSEWIHNKPAIIQHDLLYREPWTLKPDHQFFIPPATKYVTTEIHEQRWLVLEAEGLKFTNVLASVLKQRTSETFVQRVTTPPAPTWELDTNRMSVQTNFAEVLFYSDALFGTVLLTNVTGGWTNSSLTNSVLTLTNK